MPLIHTFFAVSFWAGVLFCFSLIVLDLVMRSDSAYNDLELTLSAAFGVVALVIVIASLVLTLRVEAAATVIGGFIMGVAAPYLLRTLFRFLKRQLLELYHGPESGSHARS